MTNAADVAISVTDFVGSTAGLATKIGGVALPVARFFAGWVPGLRPALDVLEISAPIIAKIAAGAPVAVKAINAGRPIIAAVQESGGDVLANVKQLFALAVNSDPARPETTMTAADVTDEAVAEFAGMIFTPGWTNEEQQRHWDRASANLG